MKIYIAFLQILPGKNLKREPYHREGIIGDNDDFDDVEELIRFIKTGSK